MKSTLKNGSILSQLAPAIIGLTMMSSPAIAQDADGAEASSSPRGASNEIVVVARRREENLQEVPVSITAFGVEDIETQTIRTIQDFSAATPGLLIARDTVAAGGATINLRGQNQQETQINGDPAVGIYADGVYLARNPGMLLNMVDVERVEVLKGPQGTLFGRNSTGGALNITTRLPEFNEFSGEGKVLIGNYGRNDVTAIINVPMVEDTLASRFVYQHNNSSGYTKNAFDGANLDDENDYSIRGALRFQPDDTLEIILRGDYSKADRGGVGAKLIWVNPRGPGQSVVGLADPDRAISYDPAIHRGQFSGCTVTLLTGGTCNFGGDPSVALFAPLIDGSESLEDYLSLPLYTAAPGFYNEPLQAPIDGFPERRNGFNKFDVWGLSLTATKEFEPFEVKTILAYREMSTFSNIDVDGTPFPLVDSIVIQDQKQFSAELQISGVTPLAGRDLDWVAGFFYFDESGLSRSDSYAIDPLNPFNPSVLRGEADNRSIAGFLSTIYPVTDALRLSAGIRYTEDRKDLVGGPYSGDIPGTPFSCGIPMALLDGLPGTSPETCVASFSDTFDAISWDVGLDYQVLDAPDQSMMIYAKVSKGFRSGGQNLNNVSVENSFNEETVYSYEAGIKSDWLDRRLRLNFAFYLQDYQDLLLTAVVADAQGNLTTKFSNVADATIQGFEFEMVANPVDNFTLSATAAWTDPKYDEFLEPTADPNVFTDRSDELFERVPEWTYSVQGTYIVPLDAGDLTFSALWAWQDDVHFAEIAYLSGNTQPAVGTLDARISFEMPETGLTVALWGKNLTDEAIIERTTDFSRSLGHVIGLYRPPLTWGGEVIFRF
jgi:iron complex outermembrane receptor protein